ncbi:possible allophanate hydrolase subunit 1 [Psychrobacter arcticus 273-4]|uniref:Possible allophanate hydrolase subunit 1 n=1 Tax=Psychrobacter arcticus (strain DSM 17307 / VKM B-2377 / 273-4) TaxID=259536 RepID=Q4FSQ7_PSYA2|nr:5-oxoprolinase subunit PxpB [Psychrobacter arcticus]AAZ18951.1 possible allophanate hydrolase subunit 1 [Psychrobacter arcticus 273-4]
MELQWQICSETNLALFFPKPITLEKQQKCWALSDSIQKMPEVIEVVIGMNTLSVFILPLTWAKLNIFKDKLSALLNDIPSKTIQGKHVEIPVHYGGKYGPDLAAMANDLNLSVEAVVELHTKATYTVYFIGFQPGFPYLGGLSESLYFPRHAIPRTQVPAGSVGIGGEQTGIYPFASPGGWQLLGQANTALFDSTKTSPTLLNAGDTLTFTAIDIHQ